MDESLTPPFRILGIAGSLRRNSYNRALLRAAQELAPDGVEITIEESLGTLPHYDDDLRQQGEPEAVVALKERVRAADALLIATPEYNYSIPGVLKNAIDWLSRPPAESPLRFKPAAIMGASMGLFGTVRAQLHLRQVFVFTETYVLPKPEVLLPQAHTRFDEHLRLVDEVAQGFLRDLLAALVEWARRVRRDPPAF